MEGSVDAHGLRFHWELTLHGTGECTLAVHFADLATDHDYPEALSREQAQREAAKLARQLLRRAQQKDRQNDQPQS